MPLTLVLGPANSAKAGEVLGAYATAAPRGALLVVPTALDAEHYSRELASRGVVLHSVLTFAGLAALLARRAGYSGRRLTALQREWVLRGVVRRARHAGLASMGSSCAAPGFSPAVGKLMVELQRSLVSPQRFGVALRAWAEADERRGPYARELASLYLAYVSELDRIGWVDGELYAWRALDALRAQPGRWGDTPVFFYGFDDLDALQRDGIETLSHHCKAQLTVSLTYEAGRPALAARAEAVEELRVLAERVIELPASDEHYEPGARAALHHLERRLFDPAPARMDSSSTVAPRPDPGPAAAPARVDPGPAVALLEAGGERAEAELVAAEVLALLRAGARAEEVAIVHRSLSRAAPLLERVLRRCGIAVASDLELPFVHTALGRGVLALARCALLGDEHARAEDLLAYLRTPGVLRRLEIADELQASVRREGLHSAGEARARLGWRLAEIEELRETRDPVAELGRQARRLFAAPYQGAATALGSPHARSAAPVLEPAQALDAQALATLLRAMGELQELGEMGWAGGVGGVGEVGERVTGPELIELLESLRVPAGAPLRPGAVLLAGPLAIRARRFRAVLVCGLQEGHFPMPGSPDPFLSDERRWEIALASGLRLRPHEDSLARERHLFYACISRATERVVLSYRSSDEEGNLELPSPFIADVAGLLSEGWTERRRRRLLADVTWAPESAPTARELARAQALAEAQALAGARALAGAPAPGVPTEDRSLGAVALRHVRHVSVLSAGALETYGDCPVKWLVERELQPSCLEPEPDPIARGQAMHSALEQVLRRLGGAVTPQSLPDADRILEEILGTLPPALGPGASAALSAAALRSVEADLRRYLKHEAASGCGWEPQGLELRFGFEDEPGSLPALALGEGRERVFLRGVVDRLDADPGAGVDPAGTIDPGRGGGAIVRDYKSGRTRPEQQGARWAPDRRLQVALYMLAIRELMGLTPVAGLYQPLGGSDLRARGVFLKGAPVGTCVVPNDARERVELDDVLRDAEARALALAARLRAGELTPCPERCSRNGCRHPGICRAG